MKMLSIIILTFRESFAKKTFIAFLGISSFVAFLFLVALNLDIVDGFKASITILDESGSPGEGAVRVVREIQGVVVVMLYTGGLFMSLFATSSLIPNMMQAGFVDIMISKPLSRTSILLGRYLGAIAIVAFNIFYLIITTWLLLSIKSGVWNFGYLRAGWIIVIAFSALFALMTLLGVATGSGSFSLMITYLVLFFSPLLLQHDKIVAMTSSSFAGWLVDTIYYILPKTAELGNMTQQITKGIPMASMMPLWSTMLFGLGAFFVSAVLFSRKDF